MLSDFQYCIQLMLKNQANIKTHPKNFNDKYHDFHCTTGCRSVYTVSDKRLRHGGSGYETIRNGSEHILNHEHAASASAYF